MMKNKFSAKVEFVDVTTKTRFQTGQKVPESVARRHTSRVKQQPEKKKD